MNTFYSDFIQKHLDILSFRDLAPKTVSTYISYLDEFLCWTENELSGKPLSDVSYEEIYYLSGDTFILCNTEYKRK